VGGLQKVSDGKGVNVTGGLGGHVAQTALRTYAPTAPTDRQRGERFARTIRAPDRTAVGLGELPGYQSSSQRRQYTFLPSESEVTPHRRKHVSD